MEAAKKTLAVLLCLSACATASEFDLAAYQDFLEQHQDMTSSELLQIHPPGDFVEDVNISWHSAAYSGAVDALYGLTDDEKMLLQKHGFVVTERLRKDSFVEQLREIWVNDLPLFISADAILHAFHYYYDTLMIDIEEGVLSDHLTTLLAELHNTLPDLAAKYAGEPGMQRMLMDVDVYLTVPLELLGQSVSPHYPESQAEIDQLLELIAGETVATYPLFSEHCREIDFSQFRPRGHYSQYSSLSRYFRAMMWLGRMEFYLLPPQTISFPCPEQTVADIQRQTIDAVLIVELMELAGVNSVHGDMEDILSLLAGEQDNVTVSNLTSIIGAMNLQSADQLLDTSVLEEFQDALAAQPFAAQQILSQILRSNPMSPDRVVPASAFMLFGQRFVIDSYVTGNVVYDKVIYEDRAICRLFPSTLDILFALGNDAAGPLLVSELDEYCYASNLGGLRYLVDSFDSSFWRSSIYNTWLNSIRALNPPSERTSLPRFMQTEAWWLEKMNTQLAAWAELRHDNLLYAKQSYTGGGGACSYPHVYVEPFDQLYQRIGEIAETAHSRFLDIPFSDEALKTNILDYYSLLDTVATTLAGIAQKELTGNPLSAEEIAFLQGAYSGQHNAIQTGCASGPFMHIPPDIDGWYLKLLYGPSYTPDEAFAPFSDYLVADYHTTPTDCWGTTKGWVSHAGTGPVDMVIVVVTMPDAGPVAFVGPVMSYYEYTTTGFLRLTDEEWEWTYLELADRPTWTATYLADNSGASHDTADGSE